MSCERVKRLLNDYLCGVLTEHQAEAVEQHLELCPDCQAQFLPSDLELEALLASDWYAAEPTAALLPQIMDSLPQPQPRPYPWGKIAIMLTAWSCYFALWLMGTTAFWYPRLYLRVYRWLMGVREGWQVFLAVARSVRNALSLLAPTPLGVGLLLILVVVLSYCLYRVEREENLL